MSDVLLLHAGIADRRMWGPQVDALEAAGHRALAPDLPGFGNAKLEPGVVDYVAFAAGQLAGAAVVIGCSGQPLFACTSSSSVSPSWS